MAMRMFSPSLSSSHRPLHHHDKHHQSFLQKPNPNPNPNSTVFPTLSPPKVATQTTPKLSPTPLSQTVQRLCESGNLHEALHTLKTTTATNAAIFTNLHEQAESINTLLLVSGQRNELDIGREVHKMLSKSIYLRDDYVINTRLITFYATCGCMLDARKVFDEITRRNMYQWNALITGYARNELWFDAVLVFCELMRESEFRVNSYTLPSVIKACGGMYCVEVGKAVHGMGVKMGLSCDEYVCNALIAMYGKCGVVEEGVKVFENVSERSVVAWNALIIGLNESGFGGDGLDKFREMVCGDDCLVPDDRTLVTVLSVCGGMGDVDMGRVVHGLGVKLGFNEELIVSNALVEMYVQCGCVLDAEKAFNRQVERDFVSWNAMISGYARAGDVFATFDLVRQMQFEEREVVRANVITIFNVLPACLDQKELRSLKELHGFAFRNGFHSDDQLARAFVLSYAKCGSLSFAEHVFRNMDSKTIGSRNALISGYAQDGDARKALDSFLQMTSLGAQTDCL